MILLPHYPTYSIHCPKSNLILHLKTEPFTAGADTTVYVWLLCPHIWPRNPTYTVTSASNVTCSIFNQRLGLFLGQCRVLDSSELTILWYTMSLFIVILMLWFSDLIPLCFCANSTKGSMCYEFLSLQIYQCLGNLQLINNLPYMTPREKETQWHFK